MRFHVPAWFAVVESAGYYVSKVGEAAPEDAGVDVGEVVWWTG